MTDIQRLRDAGFGSLPIEHDTKAVEETSFESFLTLSISIFFLCFVLNFYT